MLNRSLLAASAASLIMSTAAFADTGFSAGTDLNVRKGPGPGHPVVGVIPAGETVQINGCLSEANWCRVSYGTTDGWASSDYLTVTGTEADGVVVLSQRPATVQVEPHEDDVAQAAFTERLARLLGVVPREKIKLLGPAYVRFTQKGEMWGACSDRQRGSRTRS